MKVVGETKDFYDGRDGLLYRGKDDARASGGTGRPVEEVLPEYVAGVVPMLPHETHHTADPELVWDTAFALEAALAKVTREHPAGGPGVVAFSDLINEVPPLRTTAVGNFPLVGPRPINDWSGAHVHYSIGVPIAGLEEFLWHVLAGTWRTEALGYLTQAHLLDGFTFAGAAAARFERFASGVVSGWHQVHLTSLRGYLALLYSNAAAMAQRPVYDGLGKVNLAAMSRQAMNVIRPNLPDEVQRYLKQDAEYLLGLFESVFLARIPDFPTLYRAYRPGNSLRSDRLVPSPVLDSYNFDVSATVFNYLSGGFIPGYANAMSQYDAFGGLTEFDDLDVPPDPYARSSYWRSVRTASGTSPSGRRGATTTSSPPSRSRRIRTRRKPTTPFRRPLRT